MFLNSLRLQIKVSVFNVNDDKKNLLWSFKVNKPCQHFAIAGFLNQYFTMLSNCYVKPVSIHLSKIR